MLDSIKRIFLTNKVAASRKDPEVVQTSPYENIYLCCTQKTASQWFRNVFSDHVFYKYTGLDMTLFTGWRKDVIKECFDAKMPMLEVSLCLYTSHSVSVPMPERTIGAPLYIGYKTYESIPKLSSYRTFFILRDPRDIVVSWYFSTLYSHSPTGAVPKFRRDLENLSLKEGLRYSVDSVQGFGLFDGQRSWMENAEKDKNVSIFRYEDFAEDNKRFLRELFDYLNINMLSEEFDALAHRHRFDKYSQGRKAGDLDRDSHYRKGVAGDWKNHFDVSTSSYFRQVTGDLLKVLGYREL